MLHGILLLLSGMVLFFLVGVFVDRLVRPKDEIAALAARDRKRNIKRGGGKGRGPGC